jgi:MOSC domain-containing protein YiiM
MSESKSGRVLSVNVGRPRTIDWLDRTETTSIWKSPVEGRVMVRGVNLDGDDQADREVHGGPDKAVYSYASEDTTWWEGELGRSLGPAAFGENLTLEGVDVSGATVGEHWEIGSALFEVAQPRFPCWKLGARMNDQHFPDLFRAARRPGAYLRIIREGAVGAGDEVRVVHHPTHRMTLRDVVDIYDTARDRAPEFLEIPELAVGLKSWARRRLAHSKNR